MVYLTVMKAGLDLINKASDGVLSADELEEVIGDAITDSDDVLDALHDAPEDGQLSVGEVIKILVNVLL